MKPFFVTPAASSSATRRLLLLSYHFPPGTAAGALRWEKLAPLAAERGFGLDVVTLDPASLAQRDDRRLAGLPAGTRVFGVRQPDVALDVLVSRLLTGLRSVRSRLRPSPSPTPAGIPAAAPTPAPAATRPGALSRAYGAWIDNSAHGSWAKAAADLGARLIREGRYDAIVTCGPPHTVHVAGRRLAARYGVPHVADFRDPWRLVERLADSIDSPVWHAFARWHEPAVVARASLVVMNTAAARDAMQRQYPDAADRIVAVMNGFDAEPVPAVARDERFVIAYTGSIYLDRDPGPLFSAVRRLIDRHGLTPRQLGVVFIGHVSQTRAGPTRHLAEQAGIGDYIELLPAKPRAELPQLLARAAVLVSLAQDSHMAIPSKIFEYMQFQAGLLAMAEPNSATAQLLGGTHADVVSGSDVARLAVVLEERWQCFRRGERPAPLASNAQFSRRHQAGLLLDRLDKLTAPSTIEGKLARPFAEARPA